MESQKHLTQSNTSGPQTQPLRRCIDFSKVNEISKFNVYAIPHVDDLFKCLEESQYITTLDLKKEYWQILLMRVSWEKIAFSMSWGLWVYSHGLWPTQHSSHLPKLDGWGPTTTYRLCGQLFGQCSNLQSWLGVTFRESDSSCVLFMGCWANSKPGQMCFQQEEDTIPRVPPGRWGNQNLNWWRYRPWETVLPPW